MAESPKAILTTRNVTLVSYRLDETTSSEDTQAAILTDLYTRFQNTSHYTNYNDLTRSVEDGKIAEGTFVILDDKETKTTKVVVAKIRPIIGK